MSAKKRARWGGRQPFQFSQGQGALEQYFAQHGPDLQQGQYYLQGQRTGNHAILGPLGADAALCWPMALCMPRDSAALELLLPMPVPLCLDAPQGHPHHWKAKVRLLLASMFLFLFGSLSVRAVSMEICM